jgi:hypothetical protein
MTDFPRTKVDKLSVSRLVIGTNWFLGFSHFSKAKDDLIVERMDAKHIADVIEVFAREGVNAILGVRPGCRINDAVKEGEQRTGRKIIRIAIPTLPVEKEPPDFGAAERELDKHVEIGVDICMPHQATTDALLDKRTRSIRHMDRFLKLIRERGMVPGLSTHMPETIPYADETNLDAATYVQIYNAAGFLMQVEVDWVHRIIQNAKKPVMTIKPLAAGRLMPLVGLAFSWATLRPQDMVTVGCLSPKEAAEVIELSRAFLEQRGANVELQYTRSKGSLKKNGKKG